jgi:hypothetical protein
MDGSTLSPVAPMMFRVALSAIEHVPARLVAQPLIVQHEFSDLTGKLCPLPSALPTTGLLSLSIRGRHA